MRRSLLGLVGLGLSLAVGLWWASEPRPDGEPGPEADAMARALQEASGADGWRATGAVRWNFDGRHRLLWDRRRQLVEVRWGDRRVQRALGDTRGALAWKDGQPLAGEARAAAVDQAYALWANDSFWLNPLEKLFDAGVQRSLWSSPTGERGLLVTYQSGGVTPGDSYLWLLGDDGLPRAWRMWVRIIPIGGIEASWEGWTVLGTGARVSTRHRIAGFTLAIEDVAAAATLADLTGGDDPFAAMWRGRNPPARR